MERDRVGVSNKDNHPLIIIPLLSWDNTPSFRTFTASLFNQDLKRSALGTQGKHLACCLYDESATKKVKKL